MLNNENTEVLKAKFFTAIKEAKEKDVVAFFRVELIKPWLFKEEDEYTGK
jgi:hypothetical protein